MSSKVIIIFLIVCSLIGLSFIFIRKFSQAACPSGDQRVCNFVNNNKTIATKYMKGTYEQVGEDETHNLKINWQKGGEMNRIIVLKTEKELLDVITSKRYLFLEDYSDKSWWRQEKMRVFNTLNELPFNPDMYFAKLQDLIQNENTTYKFIQEANCGTKSCYRYQVITIDQKPEEQLFVFFEKNSSLLSSVFFANENGTGEIKITYENINLAEPEKVKIASDGKNLFLDYLDNRDKPVEKNYEYLKEFEEQRKEAEENATSDLRYEEPTLTPTPTI